MKDTAKSTTGPAGRATRSHAQNGCDVVAVRRALLAAQDCLGDLNGAIRAVDMASDALPPDDEAAFYLLARVLAGMAEDLARHIAAAHAGLDQAGDAKTDDA